MPAKKLIIFTKAPIAGQVKTRLIPSIGVDKATKLHKYMLEQTVNKASRLNDINCELHCAPNTDHHFFATLSEKYNIKLVVQQGADLGEKMANAMNVTLETCSQCVIIGTDCPMMSESYLHQAFEQLVDSDIVLGPAEDGGYVLIGSKIFDAQLFANVNWSTPEVLKQTLKNINHLQLKYHKLDTLSDVDTDKDLDHLSTQFLQTAFHEMTV
jgi:uncharacterized protein